MCEKLVFQNTVTSPHARTCTHMYMYAYLDYIEIYDVLFIKQKTFYSDNSDSK